MVHSLDIDRRVNGMRGMCEMTQLIFAIGFFLALVVSFRGGVGIRNAALAAPLLWWSLFAVVSANGADFYFALLVSVRVGVRMLR